MDINSIQGTSQYLNPPAATLPSDTGSLRDLNREASKADLDEKSAQMAQQAFNIDISDEGRQRLNEIQAQAPVSGNTESNAPGGNPVQSNETNRLVNIIA